jgi:hypothetical protein
MKIPGKVMGKSGRDLTTGKSRKRKQPKLLFAFVTEVF